MSQGLSSGELFFRSAQSLRGGGWLKKGSKLVTFLNEGCDGEAIEAKYARALKELENVRVASARCRQDRVDQLREGLLEVEQLRRMYVDSARLEAEEYEGSLRELRRGLDREILRVVLRHFATVEKELSIHLRRTAADTGDCVRLKRQLKASLHLSMFALHLENETSAQVVLRKLPATHPQSVRCRRAAAENIKPNFFGGAECLYSGIDVLDVYKVENRVLLQRFQQSASTMEPGKVKGLFCSVPASTVERIVSFGMFDDSDATEAAAVHQAVFKRTWFAHRSGGGGFAEKRIAKADVVRFPLTFSRYSTLEVDRPSLSCGVDDAGPAPGGRAGGRGGGIRGGGGGGAAQTVPSGAPPVPMPPGGNPSESGGADESADGDTDGDDGSQGGIRYLVLCRVVVGKVFVTSKEYTGFPSVGANLAFDSMFNPAQEEYLIIHPRNVLPEFIVQYKYTPKEPPSTESSVAASSRSAAKSADEQDTSVGTPVRVDLSTAEVNLSVPGEFGQPDVLLNDGGKGWITPFPLTSAWRSPPNSDAVSAERSARAAVAEKNTSWEQLRLNAARQRESLLETVDEQVKSYRRRAKNIRGGSQSKADKDGARSSVKSVNVMQQRLEGAESELLKQTVRRRELETELNAARKRESAASPSGRHRRG